ncbi:MULTISPECIES: GntR family transcriptional regulator [Halomonadaceae]|uniref:GntR family transcriptional regulator n=1 Tax=Onishia taeanensis TaxID=284577 RepID=A0A328XU36_9GAMM|nr:MULTISPECIES: GntR family transcriptional regulator [Halomonas]RAR61480.1 GntR family transcriptional regulator [Halomonas taeanensis]
MGGSWQHERYGSNTPVGSRVSDEQIVEQVRRAVLTQRLPPGTRLPEVALGEAFGVSRSVVRKALTRLVANHVAVQRPNQVARVASPDVDETREIFAARRLIEGEVVALLTGTLPPAVHQRLAALAEAEKAAFTRGDEERRIEESLAFHHCLAEHSPNRTLGAMLRELILRTSIVIALYKPSDLASCYLEGDHDDLLAQLVAGQPDAARARVQMHLSSLEALLDLHAPSGAIDLGVLFGRSHSLSRRDA